MSILFSSIKKKKITTGEKDEGGVERQLDFAELELGQAFGKIENGRDQFGLDRVGCQKSLDRQERVAEQHRVLAQVVVATHPQNGQFEAPCQSTR